MTTFSQEQVSQGIERAPSPVQRLLDDGIDIEVVFAIKKKHELSDEVFNSLEKLVEASLAGLLSPTALAGELVGAGIPPTKAPLIMEDLTRALFKPLQEFMKEPEREMLAADFLDLVPDPTATEEAIDDLEIIRLPAPDHTLPAPEQPVAKRPPVASSINRLIVPAAPKPAPAVPQASPKEPVASKPPAPRAEPRIRTMAMDVEAVPTKDAAPLRPHPEPHTNAPRPAAAPKPVPPAAKASGPTQDLSSQALKVPKNYGVDPYREPVE